MCLHPWATFVVGICEAKIVIGLTQPDYKRTTTVWRLPITDRYLSLLAGFLRR